MKKTTCAGWVALKERVRPTTLYRTAFCTLTTWREKKYCGAELLKNWQYNGHDKLQKRKKKKSLFKKKKKTVVAHFSALLCT